MIAGLVAKAGAWLVGSVAGYATIAALVLGAWFVVDRNATYRERAKCDAAAVRADLEQTRKELKTERDARSRERGDLAELAEEKQRAEQANAALREEIAKLPKADQCIISRERSKRM